MGLSYPVIHRHYCMDSITLLLVILEFNNLQIRNIRIIIIYKRDVCITLSKVGLLRMGKGSLDLLFHITNQAYSMKECTVLMLCLIHHKHSLASNEGKSYASLKSRACTLHHLVLMDVYAPPIASLLCMNVRISDTH